MTNAGGPMKIQEFSKEVFSRGKLLLSGEYFVLGGAMSLSLPTKKGQSLKVKTIKSVDKHIIWSCFDERGSSWFYGRWDVNSLECIESTDEGTQKTVSKILSILKSLGKFDVLGYHESMIFRSVMEFPTNWGIGSSSTLIVNIAKAFDLDAMELGRKVFDGSLSDIATTMTAKSLLYKNDIAGPGWKEGSVCDEIKSQLYFVHLNEKTSTKDAISLVSNKNIMKEDDIAEISKISKNMTKTTSIEDFELLMQRHEDIVSKSLKIEKIGDKLFSDFWGKTKSLGAWGGDFIMASSQSSLEETKAYFSKLGFNTTLSYDEMIHQS